MAQRRRLDTFVMRGTGIALFLCLTLAIAHAQRADQSVVGAVAAAANSDDIAGVVTSSNGHEAGVWLLGMPRALPVQYTILVVTEGCGRCLNPDLPERPEH